MRNFNGFALNVWYLYWFVLIERSCISCAFSVVYPRAKQGGFALNLAELICKSLLLATSRENLLHCKHFTLCTCSWAIYIPYLTLLLFYGLLYFT